MRLKILMIAAVFASLAGAACADPMSPDEIHAALHLTPTQEPAWRAYQSALAADPSARARQQATQMLLPTLSTPRRIDLINAQMEADMAAMRRQGEAVKAFYATLTPLQQRSFDAMTAPSSDNEGQGQYRSPPPRN
jgi:hypothetical protein